MDESSLSHTRWKCQYHIILVLKFRKKYCKRIKPAYYEAPPGLILEPEWSRCEGTHDVVISGGIFDGNEKLTEKSTLVNTVHCRNIRIKNCRFLHCSQWHFIEIHSTENAIIESCVF